MARCEWADCDTRLRPDNRTRWCAEHHLRISDHWQRRAERTARWWRTYTDKGER